jgi:hypothetical protein
MDLRKTVVRIDKKINALLSERRKLVCEEFRHVNGWGVGDMVGFNYGGATERSKLLVTDLEITDRGKLVYVEVHEPGCGVCKISAYHLNPKYTRKEIFG